MAGTYGVKMSNANGLILEYDTRRYHNLAFNSAMGPDVIRLYNRVIATDLITIYKPKKDEDAQKKAFDELGNTVQDMLKSAYKNATFQVIADANDAPADAVVIEAILKDIDWGVATTADVIGGAKSEVSGSYQVIITNAQGKMLEFKNRRRHNTAMSSSKAPALIRVYNKALAKDLIVVLKNVK